MAIVQFSFSNPDVIPDVVKRVEPETAPGREVRKSHSSGVMIIAPTEKCSIESIVTGLEGAGYELVDALYQTRKDGKDPRLQRMYHMVRFVFARHEFAEVSPEFMGVRGAVREALQSMSATAMWRVRAFDNPFYRDGEEVPGQRALSLNFEARTPLNNPDGTPVAVWQRDARGAKIGTSPVPIHPLYKLVVDETVRLMPMTV
ncbi:MAG: hypothetical protein NTY61_01385 [Candidatus Parcubacteria bacterium]|nr:hypothetical protein [Candidatus Parcubacteria bacterium]